MIYTTSKVAAKHKQFIARLERMGRYDEASAQRRAASTIVKMMVAYLTGVSKTLPTCGHEWRNF